MKKLIFTLLATAGISLISFGQAPEGFKYQAVLRDASNMVLNNQPVGMQLIIHQGGISGVAVYTETFSTTSNTYGLVNLEIGTGTTTDDFTTIDWANGPYFIETAADLTGGTNYNSMGTSQLMSVPYALHAKSAENVINDQVDDADADPANEIQTLSVSNNQLSLSNGGGQVDLPGTIEYMGYSSGMGTSPTGTTQFLSSTVTVTITSSSQKVLITATKAFGSSSAGGAASLDIYPAYNIGTNTPTTIGGGIYNLQCAQSTRQTYTVTGVITGLNPGTYNFGMAGDDDGNGNWNLNEYSYVSVMVVNPY